MADGSGPHMQRAWPFPKPAHTLALRPGEKAIDLFAGGGGASEGLKQALGRDPDIAINHDLQAIGMHAANHPLTRHLREDVWLANPRELADGCPVGWLHGSPDCTHFSQAKGGQPRSKAVRGLSWVLIKWAGSLLRGGNAPRILSMENVWQILRWGPLIAKRDKATGRVITLDEVICPETGRTTYRVADPGERVPVDNQYLVPDKRHAGRTWRQFVLTLRAMGYQVDWWRLPAHEYGAGTSRTRLFLCARRDGIAPRFPVPEYGPGLKPVTTAADSIDWSIPCPSIFSRKRPLADATCRRIAKGLKRFVLDADEPFFVTEFANASRAASWSGNEPLRTICAGVKGGHFAIVAPTLVQTGYGERRGQAPRALDIKQPLGTVVAGGVKHAMVAAFLERAHGGYYDGDGADIRKPLPTINTAGTSTRLATAALAPLTPDQEAGALQVAAFLIRYYGTGGQWGDLREPLQTITTRDRIALVTVYISGDPYVIVDIGLRMLTPRELYRAQGFPDSYIIDRTADGTPLPIHAQVRMCGNSVSPHPMRALAQANLDPVAIPERLAA